jgi:hypothetical protein
MRCALVEAETREEVMREMDERMRHMEAMFRKRMTEEVGSPPPVIPALMVLIGCPAGR